MRARLPYGEYSNLAVAEQLLMTAFRFSNTTQKQWFFVVVCLYHLVLSIYYKEIAGLSITSWNVWHWHLIPKDLMELKFLESLWNLHTQPPLYNVIVWTLLKLFRPDFYPALHAFNIALGTILCGMVFYILVVITNSNRFSLVLALLISSNPALYLYEAHNLYTIATSFFIVLSVFFVARYAVTRRIIDLLFFVFSLNLLVMTRSSYHLVLSLSGLLFACLLVPRKDVLRVLLISAVICLPAVGWYGKNYVKFGFFGSSSWFGSSLWTAALGSYQYAKFPNAQKFMDDLAAGGVIDPLTAKYRSGFPSMPALRAEGFDKKSDVELLSRDDYTNINFIDASKIYLTNAIRLIKHDPKNWLKSISISYEMYCRPSTSFKHLVYSTASGRGDVRFPGNATKIPLSVSLYANYFLGQRWMTPVTQQGGIKMGSFLFFIFPATFMLYAGFVLQAGNVSWQGVFNHIKTNPTLFVINIIVIYNMATGCSLIIDENERYKFEVEQIFYAGLFGLIYTFVKMRAAGDRSNPVIPAKAGI